jgi:ADP-heptose:LPS heptosyltransferase
VGLCGVVLGVRRRSVVLGPKPRILVVRLDERVGNLVLTSPILSSLRQRFPDAQLDLLAHYRGVPLLAGHPALNDYLVFDKRRLLAAHGPLFTPWRLRRRRYDVVIDAANPSDPSTTQALLVRLCGAPHTVGYAEGRFAQLYSAPVAAHAAGLHEIDMRLALLQALPGTVSERRTSLAPLAGGEPPRRVRAYGVVNVGARLGEKRLGRQAYAALAQRVLGHGLDCLVAYGPSELGLATDSVADAPGAELAPPTSLVELTALMRQARVVLTCDTGPMHLAVAAGTPTCGLFVSTEPSRYGYAEPPHAAIDTRGRELASWITPVEAWLQERLGG